MTRRRPFLATLTFCAAALHTAAEPPKPAANPVIHADVPDMAMVRVGDTYYMSSTTMHMSPGLPIVRSKDLSTATPGGFVDFDHFRVSDRVTETR